MIDASAQLRLHEELLAGDPTAQSRVADTLFRPLVARLQSRFPRVARDTVTTAAIDAWLTYVKAPAKFNPARGKSLFGYLTMSAEGDLRNALAKERKEARRTSSLDELSPVALARLHGKMETAAEESPLAQLESKEVHRGVSPIETWLDRTFPDPTDRHLVNLIIERERRTAAYAELLGLRHLPQAEQRRLVKQHKDRINKRLKRNVRLLQN